MDKCDCYHEYEEEKYLTEFERGVHFANTGKLIESVKKTVGRCWGTKECDICNCKGDESKCDFYPEKRKEKSFLDLYVVCDKNRQCFLVGDDYCEFASSVTDLFDNKEATNLKIFYDEESAQKECDWFIEYESKYNKKKYPPLYPVKLKELYKES